MYKKLFISLVAASSLLYYQSLFAHNEGKTFVDSSAKRKAAEQQQKRDSWDSFMKTVHSQEKEQATDKQTDEFDDRRKRDNR